MSNNFIFALDYQKLVKKILNATMRIYYCVPNVHEEVAHALEAAAERVEDIRVIIDPSEDTFRNGFGDIKAIDILKKAGVQLFEESNNMVSFIIVDDEGYFIFPQSRIYAEEGAGSNAVRMNALIAHKVLLHYFPPNSEGEKQEYRDAIVRAYETTNNDFAESAKEVDEIVGNGCIERLDEERLSTVRMNLDLNPPVHPDLKRQINTYTSKIQFLEIKFTGVNFHIAKINISNKILPFKDSELKRKLETKLRLFDHEFNSNPLNELHEELDKLKNEKLTRVASRDKHVFRVADKQQIKAKLEDLQNKASKLEGQFAEEIDRQILDTKEILRRELCTFFYDNPPDDVKGYSEEIKKRKIDDDVSKTISKIKFLDAAQILKRVDLKFNFYDLTFEDFRDHDFLVELTKKGIIKKNELDEIVKIKDAFEAKR